MLENYSLTITVAAAIILAGVAVWIWLRNASPVTRAKVQKILEPYVQAAIIEAYQVSERFIDLGQERMRGADKAAVARGLYHRLPREIAGIPISVIYTFITEEEFAHMVQNAFERLDGLLDEAQGQA